MLDSDAELSAAAACLTLACSATVVSPSILLHLACAADRAWLSRHWRSSHPQVPGSSRPRVCRGVRRCLRLCVRIDAQPEEGAPRAGSASTWHVLEHRRKAGDRVGRAAEDARCCDARVRYCDPCTRTICAHVCTFSGTCRVTSCLRRARTVCAAATAHGTCRVEPLDSQCA